jgi:copper chaperone NosL
MKTQQTSNLSRILLLISSLALLISLFVPLWRIELDAPQYPEGLALQIYPHKIAGDVDIINGLNHYIGMKTLHTEDFIEFTLLPYLIGFFALLMLLNAVLARKTLLYISLFALIIFGVLSMIDFWRWNYNYGHDLDPNAAIKVPGMAYQPPIIGYKQLLNFGAYSIPDIGGWMFIFCGLLVLFAALFEWGLFSKKTAVSILLVFAGLGLIRCSEPKPTAIKLNQEDCYFCKMTITDGNFAAELITKKGRTYVFDDLVCLKGYIRENQSNPYHSIWISEFGTAELIDAEKAFYVNSAQFKSPMAGNWAAFKSKETAEQKAGELQTRVLGWSDIDNQHAGH